MRRWIVLLIALALIPAGASLAATKWKVEASQTAEPAQATVPPLEEIAPEADGSAAEGELAEVDPVTGEVTYPYWMEKTDGSETMLFMLIDFMNDEAKLVQEHGSLTIRMDYVEPDGTAYATVYETLFDTEFGKGILVYMDGYAERSYAFAYRSAVLNGDEVTVGGPQFAPDEFEDVWSGQCYPVAFEEVLHATAPAADGFTYMRTSGTYGEEGPGELEYRLGNDMRLHWVKLYEVDEAGEPTLSIVISYSVGDPVEFPDSVVQALREA